MVRLTDGFFGVRLSLSAYGKRSKTFDTASAMRHLLGDALRYNAV